MIFDLDDTSPESVQLYINSMRWFNDGAGLIVPGAVAKELKAIGVTEGYTVQQKLPRN